MSVGSNRVAERVAKLEAKIRALRQTPISSYSVQELVEKQITQAKEEISRINRNYQNEVSMEELKARNERDRNLSEQAQKWAAVVADRRQAEQEFKDKVAKAYSGAVILALVDREDALNAIARLFNGERDTVFEGYDAVYLSDGKTIALVDGNTPVIV